MNIKALTRILNLFHMSPLIRVPKNDEARKDALVRSILPMRNYCTQKQADEAFDRIRKIEF